MRKAHLCFQLGWAKWGLSISIKRPGNIYSRLSGETVVVIGLCVRPTAGVHDSGARQQGTRAGTFSSTRYCLTAVRIQDFIKQLSYKSGLNVISLKGHFTKMHVSLFLQCFPHLQGSDCNFSLQKFFFVWKMLWNTSKWILFPRPTFSN